MVSLCLRGRTCCIPFSVVSVYKGKESVLQHRDVLRSWYHRRRMRDYRHRSVRKVGVGLTPAKNTGPRYKVGDSIQVSLNNRIVDAVVRAVIEKTDGLQ